MDNPITVSLPQNLPTNWAYGQTVAPNGSDVGLAEQYGYNYLNQQINAAQQAAQEVGEAIPDLVPASDLGQPNGVAELDQNGQVPAGQLPPMNYDPAGSASAVQQNLTEHINNQDNPHSVTAAQVGADPSGSAAAVQANLTSHINNKSNPHGVTPAQIGAAPTSHTHSADQINSGILSPARGGTGVQSLSALADALFPSGVPNIVSGYYIGTGSYHASNPNSLTFNFVPKLILLFVPSGVAYVGFMNKNNATASNYLYIVCDALTTSFEKHAMPIYDDNPGYSYSCKSSDGKTIKWYCTSVEAQLNVAGAKYLYIAFG